MKLTFPPSTSDVVLARMKLLGIPMVCTDEDWEIWQSIVQRFLAGGLLIVRWNDNPGKCGGPTQTYEVR